jgi:thioredoxin-dependent peroxiredoxin
MSVRCRRIGSPALRVWNEKAIAVTKTGFIFACVISSLCLLGCAKQYKSSDMEQAASKTSPVVGRVAPDFTLLDQDGREVKLSGLKGKWVVLYFYPKDDTPGCSCQATEFTALLGQFRDMGAVVMGVSPDSPETHTQFIEKYELALTLLSDPNKEVMRQYGAWVSSAFGAETHERIIRCTYLVGPKGAIRHHWPEVIPQGHAQRVREELSRIKSSQ